jgi:hypothetical protein
MPGQCRQVREFAFNGREKSQPHPFGMIVFVISCGRPVSVVPARPLPRHSRFQRLPGQFRRRPRRATMMFLDCPAYLDARGARRCGLPAEVTDVFTLGSTDGPLDCARISCPAGHWFSAPVEFLLLTAPDASPLRHLR